MLVPHTGPLQSASAVLLGWHLVTRGSMKAVLDSNYSLAYESSPCAHRWRPSWNLSANHVIYSTTPACPWTPTTTLTRRRNGCHSTCHSSIRRRDRLGPLYLACRCHLEGSHHRSTLLGPRPWRPRCLLLRTRLTLRPLHTRTHPASLTSLLRRPRLHRAPRLEVACPASTRTRARSRRNA